MRGIYNKKTLSVFQGFVQFPPMADNEGGFGEDHLSGGSFSQLLFSDNVVGLDIDETFPYSPSFSNEKPPKMLCFGGYKKETGFAEPTRTPQKSGVTCSDSSSASSTNNTNINNNNKASKSNVGCMPYIFSVSPSILFEIREKTSHRFPFHLVFLFFAEKTKWVRKYVGANLDRPGKSSGGWSEKL